MLLDKLDKQLYKKTLEAIEKTNTKNTVNRLANIIQEQGEIVVPTTTHQIPENLQIERNYALLNEEHIRHLGYIPVPHAIYVFASSNKKNGVVIGAITYSVNNIDSLKERLSGNYDNSQKIWNLSDRKAA